MKETMVLYTVPGAGHLTPMVALAKQFIQRGFLVTIVTYDNPLKPGYAAQVSSTSPSISLLSKTTPNNSSNAVSWSHVLLLENNPKLLAFLTLLSKTESVRAVVLDFCCTEALDVTNKLDIPVYFFIAFGASALTVFLHLIEIHETCTDSLKDMGKNTISFPGIPPLPACDMPAMLLGHEKRCL